MKGFLSRIGGPPASLTLDGAGAGFVGRQFSLSRHQVTVEEKLAEGGFALVFRVRSLLDGRLYALKRMCVNDDQAMQVCMQEVSLVSSISHRNVVRYVDHVVHQLPNGVREILLLMLYYRRSLSDLLNRSAQSGSHLSEQQVWRIFCDICSAVAQLHQRRPPVMHRDLKAENVLASDDPDCSFVLCDFGSASDRPLLASQLGVARVEEEIQKYTTMAYRSPEMVNLYSGRAIDTKSDIWALGCLLYRLAYLGLPFGESSLAISSARLCLPDRPDRSAPLRRLIGWTLRPEPSDRPDILQLARLAFGLAGRHCDIAEAQSVEVPALESLPLPPSETEWRESTQLKKSPSVGHLQNQQQQQQQQKPATSGAATPSSARQRPRPGGGLQTPQALPPQPQPPHHPAVDLLSTSASSNAAGQSHMRHRRLVSDTSALTMRPALPSAPSRLAEKPADSGATRQRVVSMEKISAPAEPAVDLLVDLDSPSNSTSVASAAAAAAAYRNSSYSGWAEEAAAAFSPAMPASTVAPLEDSLFGAEFDRIRDSATNITSHQLSSNQPQIQEQQARPCAQPTAVSHAAFVRPMAPTAVTDSRTVPAAARPSATPIGQQPRQPQPQPQHRQQHSWGGPSPRHPSQLMNQQVFWPT